MSEIRKMMKDIAHNQAMGEYGKNTTLTVAEIKALHNFCEVNNQQNVVLVCTPCGLGDIHEVALQDVFFKTENKKDILFDITDYDSF